MCKTSEIDGSLFEIYFFIDAENGWKMSSTASLSTEVLVWHAQHH